MSLSGAVQVITLSGAIGLQSNSACLLGHLCLAHMSNSYSHSSGEFVHSHWTMTSLQSSLWPCDRCVIILSVPQDFSYLPEKSVIRSVVTFLTEAGKKGSCPSVTVVSHVHMSPFHFLSFLWMQVQTLSTRSWLKPLWPLLHRSGTASNSRPSTGAFLSLLWWDWVLVRLTAVVFIFQGVGPTGRCWECCFCWQERMFSISVWCWQHLKLTLLRVLLSFWAPGCRHHSFTA